MEIASSEARTLSLKEKIALGGFALLQAPSIIWGAQHLEVRLSMEQRAMNLLKETQWIAVVPKRWANIRTNFANDTVVIHTKEWTFTYNSETNTITKS